MEYRLPDGTLYPKYLIPKTSYLGEINWDDLIALVPEAEVIRRSDLACEDTFNELGILREAALDYKRLPSLSLHMIGGGLQIEDIFFKQKGPGGVKWPAGGKVDVQPLLAAVEIQAPYCPIFFLAKDLHNHTFPYQRSGEDKVARQLAIAFNSVADPENGGFPFKGRMHLHHDPIQLNYWHTELRFTDVEGVVVEQAKKGWRKNAFKHALAHQMTAKAYRLCKAPEAVIDTSIYTLP